MIPLPPIGVPDKYTSFTNTFQSQSPYQLIRCFNIYYQRIFIIISKSIYTGYIAAFCIIPFGKNNSALSILLPSHVPPLGEPLKSTAIGWSLKRYLVQHPLRRNSFSNNYRTVVNITKTICSSEGNVSLPSISTWT